PDHGSDDWDRHGFASSCPHLTVAGVVVFTFGTSDFSSWGSHQKFDCYQASALRESAFDRVRPGWPRRFCSWEDLIRRAGSTHYCELSDIDRVLAGDSAVAEVEMHEDLEINDRSRNGTGNEVVCSILDGESAQLTNVRRKFTRDLIFDQAEDLEVLKGADARRYPVGDAFLVGDYAGADTVGRSGSSSFLPCSQPLGLLPVRGGVGEDGVDRVRSGLLCLASNFGSHHRVL
ncbi:hypothetical protein U1Q18_024628, partial [Sarracenia purpurea var. burkii]